MQTECKECGALFPDGGAEFCRCKRDFESWRLLSEDEIEDVAPFVSEEDDSSRMIEELPDPQCIGLEAIRMTGDERRMEMIDRILEKERFLD